MLRISLKISPYRFNLTAFLVCAALLGYAFYLEYFGGLEPCPLCIFQRVGVAALGIVFLIAAVHNPARIGRRVYGVLIALTAVAGASVSARHLWIQSLPAGQIPDCGADLAYLFEMLPWVEVVKRVLSRSGECAEIVWTFLGLSMPAWVLIWFAALGAIGLLVNWMSEQ